MPITVNDLAAYKRDGRRFTMVTAYDHPTARLLCEAEIPVLLVGERVGTMAVGYQTTLPVTMEEMLHHARAVSRGASLPLLVGDMPFGSYQGSLDAAVDNAAAFIKVGIHAVKMEGGGFTGEVTRRLVERGIPVMGHLGLTPQFVNAMGGM